MIKGTTTSAPNAFPCKMPVTVTVVGPAFSLISAGLTSSVIDSLVESSSVIRIPVSYLSLPTHAITVKARALLPSWSSATVTVIVVIPFFWPCGMTSGCTLTW